MNNADEIMFRCSSLGYLMTEPKEKSPMQNWLDAKESLVSMVKKYDETDNKKTKTAEKLLTSIENKAASIAILEKHKDDLHISETTKTHLVDIFVSAKYGRHEEITGKQLEKGNAREEDSITLVALNTKIMFKKNGVHLENGLIKGTPDIFTGESIGNAKTVRDTKTSWSAHTFFRTKNSDCPKMNYWQIQGYMALTGAEKGFIDYCLVNGTPQAILDEKRKASYQFGIDFENDPQYVEKCKQIELNHIFDIDSFRKENPWFDFHNEEWNDIPMKERHFFFEFERNQEDINRLYQRVKDSREWMNEHLFVTSPNLLINA